MQRGMELHRYTGTRPFAPWHGMTPPGHCRQCGQPSASCCCGCRECRKEAKELLVTPDATKDTGGGTTLGGGQLNLLRSLDFSPMESGLQDAALSRLGTIGKTFIGGGCCVTLAVEYAPSAATAAFGVAVAVKDSEGTTMIWSRQEPVGTGYRVHECIISTKPGATLILEVSNCTARVRWCEVFSC